MDPVQVSAIIAAGAAILASVFTQWFGALGRRGDRKEARRLKGMDLHREACDAVRNTALALREAYQAAAADGTSSDLGAALSRFSAEVRRVDDSEVVKLLVKWQSAALDYAQGEGSAESEATAWGVAATKLGEWWKSTVPGHK